MLDHKSHNVEMPRIVSRIALLAFATTPFIVAFAQQDPAKKEPLAEEVFKDVKVFKGVPASDMIPAMQFMSASMNYSCGDCHDPKDYAADNKNKETTRKMILMQREINEKNFGGRLEVTCMTCHNKEEHPNGMALPEGINQRHMRMNPAPKPADVIAKFVAAAGTTTGAVVRTGTMTAPNDETAELESKPIELIQAPGGKYRLVAGDRKVTSDGKQTWYSTFAITDEPAAGFARMARTWLNEEDFKGLTRAAVTGKEKVGSSEAVVVQGFRAATHAAEEVYFDATSGLIVKLVNFRRSTVGTAVSAIDYSDYKKVGSVQVPMKVTITFAEGQSWVMEFKDAKIDSAIKEETFKVGG